MALVPRATGWFLQVVAHSRMGVRSIGSLRRHPLFHRQRDVQQPGGTLLELVAIRVRHAQQFADHQRRDRQREVRHQIGRLAHPLQIIQRRIDDLHDPRLQPAHPPH
ncbi:hypothetical protein AB0H34_22035 [Saccharopolyspora shandongensis]|uniref:hypothetical protein n=1 Tax=Saccharopolyspora shandongensis TaxID=418495 RepID=UPI003411EEE3